MATKKLINADRIRVPDRAGVLIINRYEWPVEAAANGDNIVVGYLPANCRIHALASQVVANGQTPAMTLDVCVDTVDNKLVPAVAITANTFDQTAVTDYELCETLGTSTNNRPVILALRTAPTTAGGKVIVDLAVYDPGN